MPTPPDLARARASAIRDLRFCRQIQRFHPLGERALYELLHEVGRVHGIRADLEERLDRYLAHLTVEKLRAAGALEIPPAPVHLVETGS
jgi:hypothetical protein